METEAEAPAGGSLPRALLDAEPAALGGGVRGRDTAWFRGRVPPEVCARGGPAGRPPS